jgi:chorismate mutase/prephenate dehydratase
VSDPLASLRGQIDALDDEILERLNARARLARQIGELKADGAAGDAGKVAIYRPEREAQVLRRLKAANPGPLSGEVVARLFREVMSACLALEKPLSIACLGPHGTFSEAAAIKQFGHAAAVNPHATIDDVFRAVESGADDYGVVPVENSTEGAVGRTLDLMTGSSLSVCGEVVLRVQQHLMRHASGTAPVERVYSHAQSLAQCHEWLNRELALAQRIPVASNAEAARRAAEDPASAAIAGELAAERYNLVIAHRNIEDEPNNTTRFWVLGRHAAGRSGHDKTSLVVGARNRPGAVHELLGPLARHGVSMTRLESRPARTGLWEYVFFVDLEGHRDDAGLSAALTELEHVAAFVRVLGAYPVAVL